MFRLSVVWIDNFNGDKLAGGLDGYSSGQVWSYGSGLIIVCLEIK